MNKRITWILILHTIFFSNVSFAECTNIDRVEIVNYGLYTIEEVRVEKMDSNPEGKVRVFQKIINDKETWNIPAKLNTSFGLKYKVIGFPLGCEAEIKRITQYPDSGLKNPESDNPVYSRQKNLKLISGKSYALGFNFNEPWEVVKGKWRYQLWHDNRLLMEKNFYVE